MSMDDPAATAVMRDTDMSEAAADDQDLALGKFFVRESFVYEFIK